MIPVKGPYHYFCKILLKTHLPYPSVNQISIAYKSAKPWILLELVIHHSGVQVRPENGGCRLLKSVWTHPAVSIISTYVCFHGFSITVLWGYSVQLVNCALSFSHQRPLVSKDVINAVPEAFHPNKNTIPGTNAFLLLAWKRKFEAQSPVIGDLSWKTSVMVFKHPYLLSPNCNPVNNTLRLKWDQGCGGMVLFF